MDELNDLNSDNILDSSEIDNLFTGETEEPAEQDINKEGSENNEDLLQKEKDSTTEVNVDNLFTEEPESVGSEDKSKGKEDATSEKEQSTSPDYFFSSIAKALKEEGIFPDLDDETYSKIKGAEDFRQLIENQIKVGLDEKQRRVNEALDAGIEPTEVKQYENTLSYLDSITEDKLKEEGDQGENLRKQLIYQDFINRGFSKERAQREVNRSLQEGTDIEDAKEALGSNKDFFKSSYDRIIEEANKSAEEEKDKIKEQAEKLKKSILESKEVFGEVDIDKSTRQKVYDNISKPVYRDPKTGEYYTALQKYQIDNNEDFLKNVGLIFTLTDGFKNLNGLVKGKVTKEVKKGLRELEHTLNNTARTSGGSLQFISGVNDDPESFIKKGWTLDV